MWFDASGASFSMDAKISVRFLPFAGPSPVQSWCRITPGSTIPRGHPGRSLHLFRGHVDRRSQDHAGPCQAGHVGILDASDAEVRDFRPPLQACDDIEWLYVPITMPFPWAYARASASWAPMSAALSRAVLCSPITSLSGFPSSISSALQITSSSRLTSQIVTMPGWLIRPMAFASGHRLPNNVPSPSYVV